MPLYRIGVDVGGTNTDAALVALGAGAGAGRVVASHKAPTTPRLTRGIEAAIAAVLAAAAPARVLSVTIGTTHFVNALVEADARRLDAVAVVRLCGPFTRQLPPLAGFPAALRRILDGGVHYLPGGLEMDGRPIAALDPARVRAAARAIVASGVAAVAVVAVFSPLDHAAHHEERCRDLLRDEAPGLRVVCSRDVGPTGLVERENAAVLNAAILRTGRRVISGFRRAMARLGLACPLFLSQNDGTLIDAAAAAALPVRTFASGPTNSMAGAAFLAGLNLGRPPCDADAAADEPQLLVVDIGGTTTDVCALLPSGFPRQAPGFVELAGVRTAFSMPDVVSIGLGGGSKVTVAGPAVSVGPTSVGHRLREQARVFGGPTLTATDVAVAAGTAALGDARLVTDVPPATLDGARRNIKAQLEAVIDRVRVSAAPVHVLLVGGGALLVTEPLAGVAKCIRPEHQGAANAVGAAMAKVAGEIDTLEVLDGRNEKLVVDAACQRAIERAVAKGAAADDVRIVEINKTPLQYMSQPTVRIQVRAVGRLAVPDNLEASRPTGVDADEGDEEDDDGDYDDSDDDQQDNDKEHPRSASPAPDPAMRPSLGVDLAAYRPDVRAGVWYVSDVDLELLATGCGVLGTGGGGPTYYEYLKSLAALRNGGRGKMRIVSPKALRNDDIVCLGSWYGSPSVINERTSGGNEIVDAINAVNAVKGIESFAALFPDEIGGGNGMSAFPNSVRFDRPVVDGDSMGRAFPTMYHSTFSIYGYPLVPCALTDAAGNVSVVTKVDSPVRLEKLLRTAAVELGLACAVSSNPLPGAAVKAHGVPNTLSQAWYLGRAVHLARRTKTSYVDAIFDVCAGRLLFTGKIVDVDRYIDGGYTMGTVTLAPLSADERESPAAASRQRVPTDRHMVIPFQNEFLYAAYCDAAASDASRVVACTVPNLISILGQDGEAIGSQDLRYGLRVNVIALPAHPLWRSERALKVGGPEGFGLDMPEVGVDDDFTEARSVIDEFGRGGRLGEGITANAKLH